MTTDLTFFTNEPNASLLDRFKKTLSDVKYFDVLVGYFRTSGFHLLYESLETVDHIRILVGLSVDRKTFHMVEKAQSQGILNFESHKETKDRITDRVAEEITQARDSYETELGVQKFIEFIREGKLEIKAYPSENIHAKVYISRFDEDDRDYGRVITGSSNFSWSGLVGNREFNVELKNKVDVEFALEQFEALWIDAVDISTEYVETIEQRTWLNDTIEPYELYLKFLYEYLKEDINIDEEELDIYLPNGFLELAYQKQAVTAARRILEAYGGVFIADVVGLGKTYISALLARQLQGRMLIICPPVLQDYWEATFNDFGIRGHKVESLGKLEHLLATDLSRFEYVLIDEAHRFRNEGTQAYDNLYRICAGKRVILVSATPLNNKIKDILNQLKLFQPARRSSIPGVANLESFFRRLQKQLDEYSKNDPEYLQTLKQISQEIRNRVLRHVMVRRTRTEILNYYAEDLEQQGLTFPAVAEPQRIIYQFDSETEASFNETIRLLRRLSYARYTPLLYLNQDLTSFTEQSQRNIGGFMRSILVKRLESSFYAFRQTLTRFVTSYEKFIHMYEQGVVLISKDVDVYELLERDDPDELLSLVEQESVQQYDTDEFTDEFIERLRSDLSLLQNIQSLWQGIEQDPKLEQFVEDLQTHPNLKDKKLIIFSESKETGDYLYEKLEAEFPEQVTFYASGGGVVNESGRKISHNPAIAKQIIQQNFDPKHHNPLDNIRILITTDVLAEGINLHRANVVVNYDLPWNPTRVLQRVGRVNRVGSAHEQIYIFNCFPTALSEEQLGLEDNIIAKIQAFHDTLGEDAKYLSDDEDVTTHRLFGDRLYRRLTSRESYDTEAVEEERSELAYLQLLRQIRDNEPDLFEKIKRLPRKARTARRWDQSPVLEHDQVLTFFREGALKKFFLAVEGEPSAQELDFFAAVDWLACEPSTGRERTPKEYYDLLKLNKDTFDRREQAEEEAPTGTRGGSSHDRFVVKCLKAREIRRYKGFTDEDEAYLTDVRTAFEDGRIPKKTAKKAKEAVERVAADPLKLLSALKRTIPAQLVLSSEPQSAPEWGNSREVVLSEYFYRTMV